MKVLFAASEAYPLIKTGGLGDVAHSLPNALAHVGLDVRLVLPAYRDVLRRVEDLQVLGWIPLGDGLDARILQGWHAAFEMPLWLVDIAHLFDREGNPYQGPDGNNWPDNPQRFTRFSQAVALLAADRLDAGWQADVVHANDWQTGLVPAWLHETATPPRCIYTIHNLAYDGQFDYATFQAMHLPPAWWSIDGAEFHGNLSPMKAGLIYSDWITTVSPTYAREIQTPEYGYGYADILRHQQHKLRGILNGIDTRTWDPTTDRHIAAHYRCDDQLAQGKAANRRALLKALGAPTKAQRADAPVIGFVGRLVHQKGIDLLFDAIPALLRNTLVRFAIIGSGEQQYEERLKALMAQYPARVFGYLGYSEALAHQLEAGADIFAMPSRYEPCGLNQMYSLRYGTPPVARRTGGLADTVVDSTPTTLKDGSATGFLFDAPESAALEAALRRALVLHQNPTLWHQIQCAGMAQDLDWDERARSYLALYQGAPTAEGEQQ
ncbi:MAG: glycogen synthase GlgA [Gammaproteobacteria bacterium]|nr:MAG: glycogen synthase GlgA [Gammaproteobacteria bacterium]